VPVTSPGYIPLSSDSHPPSSTLASAIYASTDMSERARALARSPLTMAGNFPERREPVDVMDVHFSEYAFFRFRDNAAGSDGAGRVLFAAG